MKRLLTSAAVAAVLVAGAGSDAQAQEMMMNRRASLFDLGLYAGYSWTSDWATSANFPNPTIGDAPVFGATATFWANPFIGVRSHLAYIPSGFGPRSDNAVVGFPGRGLRPVPDFFDSDGRYVNNYLYDLNLVFRPLFAMENGILSSLYGFLGGGALTTNVAGNDGCVFPYNLESACLPLDPRLATVGQGTAGLGFNVIAFPGLAGVGIFAEGAAHVYDSPMHFGPAWTGNPRVPGAVDEDFVLTARGVAGLKFAFGDVGPEEAIVVPPPPPPPPPAPVPVPVPVTPPPPVVENPIRVCVIQGTALTDVDAIYVPSRGDTLVVVNGVRRPFAEVYPAVAPQYAASATWYVNNDRFTFMNRNYVKFGLTRVISPNELTRIGETQGVGVYAQPGMATPPDVIFVPVRPGCEFQPYQYEPVSRRVRG